MRTELHMKKGKVVVSVDHDITVPYIRVQRLATREFNKYRKEKQLPSPWVLTGRQTREHTGQTVLTDYIYTQMR